jgi:hypothetical protein
MGMSRILHRLGRRVAVVALLLTLTVMGAAWGRELPGRGAMPVSTDGKLMVSPESGTAVLRADDLFPGARRHGSVTVTNDGDAVRELELRTTVRDAPGALGGRLSEALLLRVDEIDAAGTPHELWSGRLAAITPIRQRALGAGARRTFRLTVFLPTEAPNDVQGSGVTMDLRWSG